MRLKVYRAPSVSEAMAQVRAELGPDALILSTRRIAQGIELTAGLDQAEIAEPAPRDAAPAEPPARPLPRVPGATNFAYHGIPAPLAARLAGPDLAAALRASLRFGMLPIARDGPPLLLVGMPGAGKTLSVARLATRLVLAGIPPMVVTADGRRAGAAEELAAYTRLLGAGLVVAATPATLGRALQQRPPGTPVLIDTAGVNPFCGPDLGALQALAAAARACPILIMQAGLDGAEAEEQAAAFAPLGARHLLATRLDLTRRLGSVLGAAAAADLILTEAGIGTGASDGLAPLTPEFLAERLQPAAAHPADPPPWVARRLSAADRAAASTMMEP
jgi:flagellar biosynthesis protein FlhF